MIQFLDNWVLVFLLLPTYFTFPIAHDIRRHLWIRRLVKYSTAQVPAWSTLTVDCGPISRWVFFHWYRQTQLSGLCLPNHRHGLSRRQNNGRHGDKETFPLISQNTLSSVTHTVLQVYILLSNSSRAGLVDIKHCFWSWWKWVGSVLKEYMQGNKSKCFCSSIFSHGFPLRWQTVYSVLLFFHMRLEYFKIRHTHREKGGQGKSQM